MKSTLLILFILVVAASSPCAYADNNSFFGANPGATNSDPSNNQDYSHDLPEDNNPNAVLPGLNATTPTKSNKMTDFTGDEKRMQKKYKSNLAHAQEIINKGERMMKSAGDNVNNPRYKKGKIFKEIGEKSLAELKANNPFPDQKIK
jgi:hypothetical protein